MSDTAKMYRVEVSGSTWGGYNSVTFEIPLSSRAYHNISSYPRGEDARRLGMRLRPEMEEFGRISIYEIY